MEAATTNTMHQFTNVSQHEVDWLHQHYCEYAVGKWPGYAVGTQTNQHNEMWGLIARGNNSFSAYERLKRADF